jgi:DNA mismatch repair ATPase MutS
MMFHSILFERTEDTPKEETIEAPVFFADLNLDQVIDAITAGKDEYRLHPYFYTSLRDVDSIKYRHEIMQDLENHTLYDFITSFATKMRTMRKHLAQADKLYYKYQKERWFLEAVELYCDAIICLTDDLTGIAVKARGFLAFREYMMHYVTSKHFTLLLAETKKLLNDLSSVEYSLIIKNNSIRVQKYESEMDYSADVEKTFEKFKQGGTKDYQVKFIEFTEMNHVEAEALDLVAQLFPDVFLSLDDFYVRNSGYLDETIRVFDREIQFYITYLEYVAMFKRAGLKFCYPQILDNDKEVYSYEAFDLALAYKRIKEQPSVVCNDFYLTGRERIFVVSGPNQGGKTTFARTFGQMHYLASLGCLVPGTEAHLFLFDKIFTHFEQEESINNLRGKLQDDLVRIHEILKQATSSSIIIMNEIFTSTTLTDAVFLSKEVINRILELDSLCVCVTFIDELASLSEKTVSMVSTVFPDNPALRTYKIVRHPPDGLVYALAIADKYRLTYNALKDRIKP